MQLAVGAAAGIANALLHTKGKIVKIGMGGASGGGGMLGKLGAAAASMSPIPIPGLGAVDPPNEVSFMFNPTEYRLSRNVNLTNQSTPKWVGGQPEYTGTGPLTLSMQLFFDDFASAQGDVTPKIDKLFSWQLPEADSGAPPMVYLEWGSNGIAKFNGVIKDVNVTYTVFNKTGTPIQATADITIEQTVIKPTITEPGTNPTSRATDMRRVHVVVEGDSLASIAASEYGDPNYWRALAEINGIDDPLRVRPGTNLLIPSAADAARMA